MAQQKLQYRKRLAALFVSFTIVIMGTASLTRSMSLDYYTVLCTLGKIAPSSIIMGLLGWVMGMILDQPKRRQRVGYNSLFVNNLMKNDLSEKSGVETDDLAVEGI